MLSRPVALPDDVALVDDLLRACELADAVDLSLHRDALQEPQPGERLHVWLDDADRAHGFARLHFNELDDVLEGRYWYYIRPSARDQGIESGALTWAMQETTRRAAQRPCRLFTGAREDHLARCQFLEANSFTRERYFYTMKRSLDEESLTSEVPGGYAIRIATLEDAVALTDLHNRAFRGHWASQPLTVAEERTELLDPAHRSELHIVAVTRDGALACFCEASIEPMKREGIEETVGFISSLGTRPSHRGRGLGRALLLHNLRTLRALGMRKAYISVDTANATGALRLYESVGFQPFETWITYFKRL